jgi:hypothetical protein
LVNITPASVSLFNNRMNSVDTLVASAEKEETSTLPVLMDDIARERSDNGNSDEEVMDASLPIEEPISFESGSQEDIIIVAKSDV